MPSGPPQPSALSSRKVCAFSLDTSVIEEAAFRFNEGPLRHLSRQLPPWLELWMPDIVAREISQHRIEHVSRSIQQIHTAIHDLRRHVGKDFSHPKSNWLETARDTAVTIFDQQLRYFLEAHNGMILEPSHPKLSDELFRRYFQGGPPFGGGKDKKHEFPDAASLLMLDLMASEKSVQVIAVSKDSGWKAYADKSAQIYCVSSLEELTSLFMSHTPEAKFIQQRLSDVFTSTNVELKRAIKSAIETGLLSLPWRINLPRSVSVRFDARVVETKLKSFELHSDEIGLWVTSTNNDACGAEMPIDVDVSLRVEITADRYDRHGEILDALTAEAIVDQRFEIKLQIEMAGALQTNDPVELITKLSLGGGPLDIKVEANDLGSDWLDESDNLWDIPF